MSLLIIAPSVALNLYWALHDGADVEQTIFNILWIVIALVAARIVLHALAARPIAIPDGPTTVERAGERLVPAARPSAQHGPGAGGRRD